LIRLQKFYQLQRRWIVKKILPELRRLIQRLILNVLNRVFIKGSTSFTCAFIRVCQMRFSLQPVHGWTASGIPGTKNPLYRYPLCICWRGIPCTIFVISLIAETVVDILTFIFGKK